MDHRKPKAEEKGRQKREKTNRDEIMPGDSERIEIGLIVFVRDERVRVGGPSVFLSRERVEKKGREWRGERCYTGDGVLKQKCEMVRWCC